MSTALQVVNQQPDMAAIEQVLINGNLAQLTPAQRVSYYNQLCHSLGLNPLTKPFEYLNLQGKLVLYARKDCTEQLRKLHGVSVDEVRTERFEDVFVVTAKGHDKSGRSDSATGAVTVGSLKGDALANQIMKAETKAKRRFTLSICGLGFLDETEIETIPKANVEDRNYEVNQSAPVKCDKCEKEIVGITKDDGGKLTALQIVAFSEKKFNASWCWDCTVAAVNAERAAAPPADTRHPAVQAMAQRQAAREPDPHFIIDTQGKPVVAGTVTEIAETAKSFQVKFGKERLSTFPNRSICEFLRGAKGQKVILEYSISGDGKYKNIESIRKIGNRDFVDNVPAYQLNEDPDPVPADVKQGAISIPSDEELPF